MTTALDLAPAARQLTALAEGVTDDQLSAATPCKLLDVRGLLAHIMGLTLAFRDAGRKAGSPLQDVPPGPSELEDEWRTELPKRLTDMAAAWQAPQAWEGITKVGGVTLPAEAAGLAGLDELVVHGWDLARATGQLFSIDPASTRGATEFVTFITTQDGPQGGLFGPAVAVPADAPPLDRLIGLTGRDPAWA